MAKSKKQITEYIKKYCKLYSLDYVEFFYDYEGEDMYTETRVAAPIFGKDSIESKLPVISKYFGLSYDDILNTTEEGMNKWYNKYKFFYHYPRFMGAYGRTFYKDEGFAENLLMTAIFGEKAVPFQPPKRYNKQEIEARLVKTLLEIDKIIPGTYHHNATIEKFSYNTENFSSYPQVAEMVWSLLDMIAKVKELFFKGLKKDLSEEEILEYNFLVTVLGVQDVYKTDNLYYKNLIALREVYASEGYTEFYSYIKFTKLKGLYPWRCRECAEDKALVQAYINEYPEKLKELRDYAKKVLKIQCKFAWSDAEYIKEPEYIVNDRMFDDAPDFKVQEPTYVYIDKTKDEIKDDAEYAERLIRCVGCESQGGIKLPRRELPLKFWTKEIREGDFSRAEMHITALKGVKDDE